MPREGAGPDPGPTVASAKNAAAQPEWPGGPRAPTNLTCPRLPGGEGRIRELTRHPLSRRLRTLGLHPHLVRGSHAGLAPRSGTIGSAASPLLPNGTPASSASDLPAWFGELARMRPPEPHAVRRSVPIRWWPASTSYVPIPGCRILSRRPELADIFPEVEEAPVPPAPRAVRGTRQGRLHGLKAGGRTVRSASDIELVHLVDCELDDDVTRVEEQPCTLRYIQDGVWRIARPDAFVVWRGQAEFREVKYEEEAETPENERRWLDIAAALNGLGYGYRVVTEAYLKRLPRFETVTSIFEHRQTPLPPDELVDALRDLLAPGPVTLRACREALPTVRREQIFALARRGVVAFDLDAPLGPDALVRLGQRAHDPFPTPVLPEV